MFIFEISFAKQTIPGDRIAWIKAQSEKEAYEKLKKLFEDKIYIFHTLTIKEE